MLTLEEMERLAIDCFFKDNDDDLTYLCMDTTNEYFGITLTQLYSDYITTLTSLDNKILYMFRFILMTSEFRKHWSDIRCGERVTMESLQNKWISVHDVI